jgi:hypothetical protein
MPKTYTSAEADWIRTTFNKIYENLGSTLSKEPEKALEEMDYYICRGLPAPIGTRTPTAREMLDRYAEDEDYIQLF